MIRQQSWEEKLAGAVRQAQHELDDYYHGCMTEAPPSFYEREAMLAEWHKARSLADGAYPGWRFWASWSAAGVALVIFCYGAGAILAAWMEIQ